MEELQPGDRVEWTSLAFSHQRVRGTIAVVDPGYESYTYEMATLLRKTTGYDHWWFAYDNRPHGEPGDCCSEKWIHEPGVLDKLADL